MSQMTHRERQLAIMEGCPPDRIPWVPRLLLWYNAHNKAGTLPEKYQGWELRDIERDLGMGTPARVGRVHTTRLDNVEVVITQKDGATLTDYHTPVGTVSTLYRTSDVLEEADIQGRQIEYMIKSVEDYQVVEYIIEHTEIIPRYDYYLAYEAVIGEDGVPMVALGDHPMDEIMRDLIGWNRAYFELHDHPDEMEHLYHLLAEHTMEMVKVAARSPAKLVAHGSHFDSQMTSPPLFAKYWVPYFQEASQILHEGGKVLTCHADSDISLLLELIVEAGFDMAECFVTAPMVPLTLDRAREVWGNRVIIFGGLPSVLLSEPYTDEDLENYMKYLFRTIAPGDAFILGVADNVMPEAKFERIVRVGELVEEYGYYPVSVP